MKISKSKRFFTLLIATTFTLFGLLVFCPLSVFAIPIHTFRDVTFINNNSFSVVFEHLGSSFIISANSTYTRAFIEGTIPTISVLYNSSPLVLTFQGVELSVSSDSPTVIYSNSTAEIFISSSYSSFDSYYFVCSVDSSPSPDPSTPTPTPTPAPTPIPDPADWLNNYIFNQTSEDMWVGVEDINSDDVTYDVIPAWSYKNFYFRRNTTYRIIARTEQENVYYSLQYYTDLYNYVPLEYSLSSEGWFTYTELPYTSINISTGSDTNTSGIYTFVRFRHDLPTLPPVTPVPGTSFTPDPSSTPTEVPYITPIPGNPTLIPDNSTPTPIPDISGEAVAGFNKLTNIFNGIFDAAYQSVNAANGNFWTSFFFIGLPIFLVILGLIAWIIFGSSDDD